jgi:hypothetical protein
MIDTKKINFDENESDIFGYTDKFLLSINGVDLSGYVTEFSYDEYDVSTADSGLDDTATMQQEVVAKDKRKLSVVWSDCPSGYKRKIKRALKNVQFEATWVDGDDKESLTVKSYRGDRKYTMKRNRENKIYWEVSLSIIGLGGDNNVSGE